MIKAGLLFCLAGMAAGLGASAAPELTLYPASKVALPVLGVPIGVRAVGMGEAYTAAGGDVNSLHWNPAGLGRIDGFELGLMHNEWSTTLGLRQEYLAYGMSLGPASGLAASFNYFSLGTLAERSSTGALGAESGAAALSGSLGYAGGFLQDGKLKLGAAAEFGMESLFKQGSSAFGGSLGLLYDFNRQFSLGLSALHLGAAGGGFSPPSEARAGLAFATASKALVLGLDSSLPFNGDPSVNAGAELNFSGLSLRGGWRQSFSSVEGDVSSGFTAGAGFKSGFFALDYAFVPYGDFSTTHRVAVSVELPADFFKPKVIGAESSTVTARSYYDKGMDQEKKGNLLQALVEFQRAKDAYPPEMVKQKNVQFFYRNALRKIASIQKEMEKSGSNEQVRKLVAKALNEGQEYMQRKRYKDASRRFRDALAMESDNKAAKDALESAQSALRRRKRELLASASQNYDSGRLSNAILDYREVLSLDEGDDSALAFFRGHKAEIADHLRRIHRKGIDLYVSGRIREAVKQWKDGLKLDPEDPINFRRDIDKAEKVLEVRGKR
jgi:hypothetical protein